MNALTIEQRNIIAISVGQTISSLRQGLEEVLTQLQANNAEFDRINAEFLDLRKKSQENEIDNKTYQAKLHGLDNERKSLEQVETNLREKRRELSGKLDAAQGAFNALVREFGASQQ